MTSYEEVLPFLESTSQNNVRSAAVSIILGLSASVDGRQDVYKKCPQIIKSVLKLLEDADSNIVKNSLAVLINISSDKKGSTFMLEDHMQNTQSDADNKNKLLFNLLSILYDSNSELADHACVILANLTRYSEEANQVFEFLEENEEKFPLKKIISIFTSNKYNQAKCSLDHLAFFFANLSQLSKFRSFLLNREDIIIPSFFPYIDHKKSIIRRNGIIAMLKNCCFDWENHEWLLGPEVDILPRLLLPLAGSEQFDDEDNEKLPIDLQYLPEDKTREAEPSIRKSLLEAVLQLCATKKCRTIMRDCNAYIILRELHKWEKDEEVLLACENIVDILIRTEEEIGVDNLSEVEIPSDLKSKFIKLDLENKINAKSDSS